MDGYTINQLIVKTGRSRSTVKRFLAANGISPIGISGKANIYPADTAARIVESSMLDTEPDHGQDQNQGAGNENSSNTVNHEDEKIWSMIQMMDRKLQTLENQLEAKDAQIAQLSMQNAEN